MCVRGVPAELGGAKADKTQYVALIEFFITANKKLLFKIYAYRYVLVYPTNI